MHAERRVKNAQKPPRHRSPRARSIVTRAARSAPLALGLSALSCYPVGFDSASELDTVLTWKNPDGISQKFRTYAIPDAAIDLCTTSTGDVPPFGPGGAGSVGGAAGEFEDCEEADHRFDETIIETVRANMEALGFEEVPLEEGASPDVIVIPGIVASQIWFVYSSYPWWWYYGYDWYWGGYGPGWATAYPSITAIPYPTGTIVLDMLAVAEEDEDAKEVPSAWVGTIHGLIAPGTSSTDIRARIQANINQAFEQSPYLKREGP